jgi:PBP1b-binding outer membrane lipoprotein LpoB
MNRVPLTRSEIHGDMKNNVEKILIFQTLTHRLAELINSQTSGQFYTTSAVTKSSFCLFNNELIRNDNNRQI